MQHHCQCHQNFSKHTLYTNANYSILQAADSTPTPLFRMSKTLVLYPPMMTGRLECSYSSPPPWPLLLAAARVLRTSFISNVRSSTLPSWVKILIISSKNIGYNLLLTL
mmetsp:Transcript_23124/g.43114  ORF Transcript_23124/g.43114 Transcript_23124/m.43114 type:complete len:109 (+) Transcript_23124:35-361(+)